jgi:hypothetical protein
MNQIKNSQIRYFFYFCGMLLILQSDSISQQNYPIQLSLSLKKDNPGAEVKLIIQCAARDKFPKGKILLEGPNDSGVVSEVKTIWEGSSESSQFSKEFVYPFQLKQDKKADVKATFEVKTPPIGKYKPEGETYRTENLLYMHSTPHGVITSSASYHQLYVEELMQEKERKGLKGLSLEELRKKDPELAKKFDRSVGEFENKIILPEKKATLDTIPLRLKDGRKAVLIKKGDPKRLPNYKKTNEKEERREKNP